MVAAAVVVVVVVDGVGSLLFLAVEEDEDDSLRSSFAVNRDSRPSASGMVSAYRLRAPDGGQLVAVTGLSCRQLHPFATRIRALGVGTWESRAVEVERETAT